MSSDYLHDLAYPPFFHREQAPGWLAAVCAALGRPAPGAAGSRWCEIGCGEGFGATILAAANPGMHFTGIDLNAGHIATARRRAAAAGLGNLDFICADIRDPGAVEGGFDLIVTHGLLSWVPGEVRKAIAAFTAGRLNPGGIAAIHYMSEPGGAAFRAFHAVFRAVADRPDPVAEGLAVLRALRDAKAGFFQLYPNATQLLDNLLLERPAYVAHEYLNPSFEPLAFAEVRALFGQQGLGWLGSATPIENMDAVSLPAGAARAIAPVRDLVLRETMKDMARNQVLRYDIFAPPAPPVGDAAHLALLRAVDWTILPGAPAPGAVTLQTRIGPVEGDARIFRPLLRRLGEGPARYAELERIAPFAGRPGLLNQALQSALWAGIAHPLAGGTDPAPAARLNAVLLREAGDGAEIPALAAPAIGSGIAVDAATLAALSRGAGGAPLRRLVLPDEDGAGRAAPRDTSRIA